MTILANKLKKHDMDIIIMQIKITSDFVILKCVCTSKIIIIVRYACEKLLFELTLLSSMKNVVSKNSVSCCLVADEELLYVRLVQLITHVLFTGI